MSVWFCFGVRVGRSSKVRVNGPCSPHAVGVAVADDGGNGFETIDGVVTLAVEEDSADAGVVLMLDARVKKVELGREELLPMLAELDARLDNVVPVALA